MTPAENSPTPSPSAAPLTEAGVRAQADALDALRNKVTAAQAAEGKVDAVLVAQFAKEQHAFLQAKIELARRRKMGLLEPEPTPAPVAPAPAPTPTPVPTLAPTPTPAIAATTTPAAVPPAKVETSPEVQRTGPILTASRVFWLLVVFLLALLAWIMRGPLSGGQ